MATLGPAFVSRSPNSRPLSSGVWRVSKYLGAMALKADTSLSPEPSTWTLLSHRRPLIGSVSAALAEATPGRALRRWSRVSSDAQLRAGAYRSLVRRRQVRTPSVVNPRSTLYSLANVTPNKAAPTTSTIEMDI